MPRQSDRTGAQIVLDLFGTQLQQQGRGFYVSLELLAIVRGVLLKDHEQLLSREADIVSYTRESHDFARRIATAQDISPQELDGAIQGAHTRETLESLLSSLVVEIPGRRKAPAWYAAHLYPFVGELVHYDAVKRRNRIASIERYVFRDGGGWAYRVLRMDPDDSRREGTRDAFAYLVGDSGTALGLVAKALHSHDYAHVSDFDDASEASTKTFDDCSPWPELLRLGVHSIVTRMEQPRAKRIENLMHWVPYCLARHQLRLARDELGIPSELVTVDATREVGNPLRTHSQLILEEFSWNIANALVSRARQLRDAEVGPQSTNPADAEETISRWARYTEPNASFTKSPRTFFSATLGAVGALNATTGRRYFTFKAPMLEALVCATLPPGQEMEFYPFCEMLRKQYGLVIDHKTASRVELTTDIDAGLFRRNAEAFKVRLASAGLLTHYSDATSLVHGETR